MTSRLVITVHGIRTFGQWQERLACLIAARDSTVRVENYHYGYFSVLAFLIPPFRWLATRRFRKAVARIASTANGAEISIVAHSFGTHLVGWGLRGFAKERRPRIHTVVLAGSVLRSGFPWSDLLEDGSIYRVVNDCGIHDNVLLLSQLLVLLTGMAGRLGFTGMTGERFRNRYFRGGHSHYFERDGKPYNDLMKQYWVPILTSDADVERVDERVTKGPVQGAAITLLQLADPLKLILYSGLVFSLVYKGYIEPSRKAEAEAEATLYAIEVAERQTGRMVALWFESAAATGFLPADARMKAIASTMWALDDALQIDIESARLTPLSRHALDQLMQVLDSVSYRGAFLVAASTGRFCIVTGKDGSSSLAPDDYQVDEGCQASQAYAQKMSERLSDVVGTYLTSKGITRDRIETLAQGHNRGPAKYPYPRGGYAKQWNLIARSNQHVEVRLLY